MFFACARENEREPPEGYPHPQNEVNKVNTLIINELAGKQEVNNG
jgi:hypothetical protein